MESNDDGCIYWNSICDTPFWNSAVTWNTTAPVLTPCFVDTVLVWLPTIFIFILFPYTLFDYIQQKRPIISWNRLNVIKLTFSVFLATIGLAHAIYAIYQRFSNKNVVEESNISSTVLATIDTQFTNAKIIGVILNFVSFLLLVLFIYLQRIFGFINGGAIWFYLLIQLICTAVSIPTWHYFTNHRSDVEKIFGYLELAFEVILFVACSFADRVPNLNEFFSSPAMYGQTNMDYAIQGEESDEENENFKPKKLICPKETASVPAKLSFWWFDSMAILGYRRPLVLNDLWQIRRSDYATTLFNQFNYYWGHGSFTGNFNPNDSDPYHRKQSTKPMHLNGQFSNDLMTENGSKKNFFNRKNTYLMSDYNKISNGSDMHHELDDEDNNEEEFIYYTPPPKMNVFLNLTKTFWQFFLFPSAARFLTDHLQLANPMVMKYMISFTTNDTEPFWHGIFYALIFVVTNVLTSITSAYHQNRMNILGMRIRTCLIASVYRKSLVLAMHSKKNYTSGEIVNLMSVDCQRFVDLLPYLCYLWTAPFQIAVALWLLWSELGISVLGGLGLMLCFIPLNAFIASMVKRIQHRQMALKDKRLKAVNELLNGIKVLKLYAWEEPFVGNIQNIRLKELNYIRKSGLISTIFNLISACSPFMVACITFTIYIFSDPSNKLTADKAFVSIALFNLLRVPLTMIPNMLSNLILTLVSVKRINTFLNMDEITPYVTRRVDKVNAITVKNAFFSWDSLSPEEITHHIKRAKAETSGLNSTVTLSNINLTIPKGSLVAVVGSVGSGKSSFLYALLGEIQKLSGSVNISGDLKLAYVAQQAWIQNSTVQGNILFGSKYEPRKYDEVIDACALRTDFEILTAGDQTEIGEKGINLSGGQKQRVSIARACYSDADIYLFDDPLSAVDSHVGKHIFDHVLSSDLGILQGRTRILVTNALYMLHRVDQIVLLKNGRVEGVGTYNELLETNPNFSELITNYSSGNIDNNKEDEIEEQVEMVEIENNENALLQDANAAMMRSMSVSSTKIQFVKERHRSSLSVSSHQSKAPEKTAKEKKAAAKLVEAESVETGQVTWTVYKKFFRAVSYIGTIVIILNYFFIVCANTGSNMWLSKWTDDLKEGQERSHFYLGIYFVIGMSQVIFVSLGWVSIVYGILRASRTLHYKLLNSIVHAPMHFFDTTPLGRILNRFSKDIDTLDNYIQLIIRVVLNTSYTVLATIVIISMQTPWFLIVVVPFVILYFIIQRFYVSTSRQLKRLEAVTRSPIFTHFSETINGVSTIKAYNVAERFISESDARVDVNQRCFYPNSVSNCWLQVRLEFLANVLIFFAALFAALSKVMNTKLTGSQTGLSLSYALNVTLSLNMCVRMFAEIENQIVSVERISEYTDVPPEADWVKNEDSKVSPQWPEQGVIKFDNYGTRYRPGLDLVLHKVDITTNKSEKIGIVGRTGAGKSSLTLALFRIIEAAKGTIWMDGINVSTLGLHTLRSRITIIPQDPVLFCGTIRSNLDPFDRYTDEQLWNVIELAHLKPFVKSLELGLQYPIAEGGENLSVGQRQLICLARALLRRTNVLVLDEATAAVDFETDSLIQTTIREQFSHCTVLTIAHRLNTILDSDRVMVLDAGNVAEFDSPKTLLADDKSIFYSLAKDAGIVS